MNTGCPGCDKTMIEKGGMCPKHEIEFLQWRAKDAEQDYQDAKARYEQKQERESNG